MLSVLSLTVFAQQKKVAVYVIGEDAGINKVVGSKLVSAIAKSDEYTAIERTTAFLTQLSQEQKYQRTGAVDDNDISRLGKQFGVQYVCVADVTEAFKEKYISARFINVESAQVERTASSSGNIRSLDDIVVAADAVCNELLASMGKDKQSDLKKVAVYVVQNDAGKDVEKVLGDKLVAGFTHSGRYIAIERTNGFLTQLSKEQKYQRTGAVDDTDISRLGKQFGVQYVCVADVSDIFDQKYISARLIDVETAEVVNSYDKGGDLNTMNNCLKMANTVAMNLCKGSFNEEADAEFVRMMERENKRIEASENKGKVLFQANVEFSGMVGAGSGGVRYFHECYTTGSAWGGIGIDGVFGIRTVNRINFLGIGLGFHGQFSKVGVKNTYYYFDAHGSDEGNKLQLWYMPIYVNDRIYIPTRAGINPFVDVSLGGYVILGGKSEHGNFDRHYYRGYAKGGLLFRIGTGLEWNRFNFGVGYHLQHVKILRTSCLHEAYFKVGYRFGKTDKSDKRMY